MVSPLVQDTHLSGRPRRDEERLAHELVDGEGLDAVVLLQRPPPLRVQVHRPRVGPVAVRPGVVQGVVRGVQLLAPVLVRQSGGRWRMLMGLLWLGLGDLRD